MCRVLCDTINSAFGSLPYQPAAASSIPLPHPPNPLHNPCTQPVHRPRPTNLRRHHGPRSSPEMVPRQQPPVFHVALVLVSFAVRRQHHRPQPRQRPCRKDVPQIQSQNVDGKVVDVRRRIQSPAHMQLAHVAGPQPPLGRFHLYPKEPPLVLHNHVVSRRISPWFRHRKTQPRSHRHKQQLHPLPPPLVIRKNLPTPPPHRFSPYRFHRRHSPLKGRYLRGCHSEPG